MKAYDSPMDIRRREEKIRDEANRLRALQAQKVFFLFFFCFVLFCFVFSFTSHFCFFLFLKWETVQIIRMKKGENVMMTERNAKNARPRMERRKRMKSRADIIPVALENLKGLKGLRGLTSYPRSQKRRQLKDLPRNQRNLLRNHPRMWTSSLISGKKSNPAAKRKFPGLLLLPKRVRKKNPEVAATTMMINTGVIVDTAIVIAVRRVTVIVTGRGETRKERRGKEERN